MEHDKEKKEQDDKKFFRNESDNTEQTGENTRKRVTIPLPDVDFTIHKEPPTPSPEALTGLKLKEKKVPLDTTKTEEEVFDEKEKASPGAPTHLTGDRHYGKKGSNLGLLLLAFFLSILLTVSISGNIFFANYVSSVKKSVANDTKAVDSIIAEKAKMAEERKRLETDLNRLETSLGTAANKGNMLEKQNETLRNELAESRKAYTELEGKIKNYADEIKKLSTTRIGFFDIYKDEKENAQRLNLKVKTLEQEKEVLLNQLNSADSTFKEQEAFYIYDMAFLSVEAGMFDAAIEYFNRFMELTQDDPDIHYNLAIIYERIKKDNHKAIYHYQKYLELNPGAQDLYEVTMRIESLKRVGTEKKSLKNFKINLDKFNY